MFPWPIFAPRACSTASIDLGARLSNTERHTERYGLRLSFQIVISPTFSVVILGRRVNLRRSTPVYVNRLTPGKAATDLTP